MKLQKSVIEDLTQWISDNLEKPLRIEDISVVSGYSKWHLQRLFLKEVGKPLGRYLREKKLAQAASDLITTDEAILDIALKYGFSTQQAFTRIFARYYQVPPGIWRTQNKHPPSGYLEV